MVSQPHLLLGFIVTYLPLYPILMQGFRHCHCHVHLGVGAVELNKIEDGHGKFFLSRPVLPKPHHRYAYKGMVIRTGSAIEDSELEVWM